jgi:hypothetical protein
MEAARITFNVLIFGSAAVSMGFVVVQSALCFRDFIRWYERRWSAGEAPSLRQIPFSPAAWDASIWLWRRLLSRVQDDDPASEADRSSARRHGARALLGTVVFLLITGLAFLVGPALD